MTDNSRHRLLVVFRIEALIGELISDMVQGLVGGRLVMVNRSSVNAYEDDLTGAVTLGNKVSVRKLDGRSSTPFSRNMAVLSMVHWLLKEDLVVSQRELFYLLVNCFKCQRELNLAVMDVSATLGVPRFALNIDAGSRGLVAGCVKIALATSASLIDCEYVGTVRLIVQRGITQSFCCALLQR